MMSDVIEQRPKDVVHSKRSYKLYIIYNFWLYFVVVICFFLKLFRFVFGLNFILRVQFFTALRCADEIYDEVYTSIYT